MSDNYRELDGQDEQASCTTYRRCGSRSDCQLDLACELGMDKMGRVALSLESSMLSQHQRLPEWTPT